MPVKPQVNSTAYLANEMLGFHAALAIVWSFIIEDANQKSDKNRIDIFKEGFLFPDCVHDTYPEHVYKMLYYSKYNNNYDIFAFAHILFLIEAYTESVRKNEIIGKIQ
jgi:hypothetical protein